MQADGTAEQSAVWKYIVAALWIRIDVCERSWVSDGQVDLEGGLSWNRCSNFFSVSTTPLLKALSSEVEAEPWGSISGSN
jgi:hypothetical protein